MNREQISGLVTQFLNSYNAVAKDRTWQQHSETFRRFWSERVIAPGGAPLTDAECDVIIRILDFHAKGKTSADEAVAKTMVPQDAWRRLFKGLQQNAELAGLLDSVFREQDLERKASLIDQLYAENEEKNRLTGQGGSALNALLAAYDPVNNLTVVSLAHRKKQMDFLELILPFDWSQATIGKRIVQSNVLLRDATGALGVDGSARTKSCFWYFRTVRDLWKPKDKVTTADNEVDEDGDSDDSEEANSTLGGANGPQPYTKAMAMKGLFLEDAQFDEMLAALQEKKNVVLQGAPGVGKTYIAKRLAYTLIGSNNPQRVETIQFHQSYSYEDFIQGFRPTPKGHFDLKYGIFHLFCRRAQNEEAAGKPYVFIIDEINRGNLSKIFGELMMLIEPDKRGNEHAIPLAYSQDGEEKFYIPDNLHLLGMMNTADRSLAMVDYALRRRFRFITLRPEFSSEGFRAHLTDAGAEPELIAKIIARMTTLNEVIAADTKNLGPGYQLGHSYFCPRNGTKLDNNWYRRVIESEIMPLLQEYWFDNEQKVKDQRSALLA